MARGSAYAKGKWALGECARSGRKMLLRNMIADGYYPNLIVDPEWYEPKHPQESLPSVRDPVSLYRPAPDRDQVSAVLSFAAVAGLDPVPGGGFGDPGGGGATGGGSGASSVQFGYETAAVLLTEVPKPTTYNSPSVWTLIEEWDTNNGVGMNEMASIFAAFNSVPRGNSGCAWNVDGTRLTLGSSSDDFIRSFICSTPFDPDTASLSASRAELNPSHLYINQAGTQCIFIRATDTIENAPCSNFIIGAGAQTSDVTDTEFDWTASGDGGYYPKNDFSFIIWDGANGGNGTRKGSFTPNGNLDSFVLGSKVFGLPYTRNAAIGGSKISKDGTKFYRGVGGAGIETITLTTPDDPTGGLSAVTDQVSGIISFFPDYVFVNPENTEEVWIVGDNAGLQMARIATNV